MKLINIKQDPYSIGFWMVIALIAISDFNIAQSIGVYCWMLCAHPKPEIPGEL